MCRSLTWLCFMNVILVGMAFVVLDNDVFNVDYHSGFAEISKKGHSAISLPEAIDLPWEVSR